MIGSEKYSVKSLTKENKSSSTTPIKFNGSWSYLVAIKLDDNFNLEGLSVIDYLSLKEILDSFSLKTRKNSRGKKVISVVENIKRTYVSKIILKNIC